MDIKVPSNSYLEISSGYPIKWKTGIISWVFCFGQTLLEIRAGWKGEVPLSSKEVGGVLSAPDTKQAPGCFYLSMVCLTCLSMVSGGVGEPANLAGVGYAMAPLISQVSPMHHHRHRGWGQQNTGSIPACVHLALVPVSAMALGHVSALESPEQ